MYNFKLVSTSYSKVTLLRVTQLQSAGSHIQGLAERSKLISKRDPVDGVMRRRSASNRVNPSLAFRPKFMYFNVKFINIMML